MKERLSGLAMAAVTASVLLRLAYLNFCCLIPEEAYYWKYAEHLDIGYLDHPPMVALSIYIGTQLFGTTEFGVRIVGILWWLAALGFVYLLAREIYDRKSAHGACILFAVLPYFFSAGFFMTPDTPLLACWAGSLYFLHQSLVRGESRAWWGVGLMLGLGMLSKYPIALLGAATLVYMLADTEARKFFFKWQPYAAAVTALLIFSPVLIWNLEHDWASFAFQSADRLEKPLKFSFHMLVVHVLLVLTPAGFLVFIKGLKSASFRSRDGMFMWVFTLIPLLVFAFFSLTHEVKINWTGPVFLALLPYLGGTLDLMKRAWKWTIVVLFVVYVIFLQYVSSGIPGVPYPKNMHKFLTGPDVAEKVRLVAEEVRRSTGSNPVIVGMDKHYLASQLGFYLHEETAGRSLFGLPSLMYRFWTAPEDHRGQTMILISRTAGDLDDTIVQPHFDKVGPQEALDNTMNGYIVGRFYYRVAQGYRP